MKKPKFKLRLKSLHFCSLVDRPAQETATLLLTKSATDPGEIVATAKLVKTTSDEIGLAFFWAFTGTLPDGSEYHDVQGDRIATDDSMIKACAAFMENGGGVDQQHNSVDGAGKIIFAMPMNEQIASSYGLGDVKSSGFMVAIKPTAEVMAKLRSGELNGVSIAGYGEREELEKSADTDYAKRHAAIVAKLDAFDAQLAVVRGAAPVPEVVPELDPIAKAASELEAVEKSVHANVETTRSAYDACVARAAKAKFISADAAKNELRKSKDAEFIAVTEAYKNALDARSNLQMTAAQSSYAAWQTKIDALRTQLDSEAEEFAIEHNLYFSRGQYMSGAAAQLRKASPSYEDLYQQYVTAMYEQNQAANVAPEQAMSRINAQHAAAQQAHIDATTAARSVGKSTEPPAARAFREHVEGFAKAHKLSREAATMRALQNDPAAQSLYADLQAEQIAGGL